jgi:deoxyribodipyrimidine photolyase
MSVAIALFTRDLRVHDNPVLHAACYAATNVVPLFVLDSGILRGASMSANRAAFLADALVDLDAHLHQLGGRLVVRSGDVVKEVERIVANGDYMRRYLPELRGVAGPGVHQPWKLDPPSRAHLDYPDALVDLLDAAGRFHTSRTKNESTL